MYKIVNIKFDKIRQEIFIYLSISFYYGEKMDKNQLTKERRKKILLDLFRRSNRVRRVYI